MARRSRDWEEGLSKDLQKSIKARREFFLTLIDEGSGWREALLKTIKIIGVNEYVQLVGEMRSSNLLNQLKADSNMTLETLTKVTRPLGIELTFKKAG